MNITKTNNQEHQDLRYVLYVVGLGTVLFNLKPYLNSKTQQFFSQNLDNLYLLISITKKRHKAFVLIILTIPQSFS